MKYDLLFLEERLPKLNGFQWRKFSFKAVIAKFFKFTFRDNYGDAEHMGIRQIRFVRAKESK
jgi:hypothetical protein